MTRIVGWSNMAERMMEIIIPHKVLKYGKFELRNLMNSSIVRNKQTFVWFVGVGVLQKLGFDDNRYLMMELHTPNSSKGLIPLNCLKCSFFPDAWSILRPPFKT